jgi:hypothetical protein
MCARSVTDCCKDQIATYISDDDDAFYLLLSRTRPAAPCLWLAVGHHLLQLVTKLEQGADASA